MTIATKPQFCVHVHTCQSHAYEANKSKQRDTAAAVIELYSPPADQ